MVLTRGGEGLVIDLVKDMGPQLHPDKLERDHIVIDPADEILANKLTALVGRAEVARRPRSPGCSPRSPSRMALSCRQAYHPPSCGPM